MDENYCEACRHWMIKRKNLMGEYVADDMTINTFPFKFIAVKRASKKFGGGWVIEEFK